MDVVGYYWFILTSVATGCYWFLTKMMDFGWILIDAIDLTSVDKMDFGGLWLIGGCFMFLFSQCFLVDPSVSRM